MQQKLPKSVLSESDKEVDNHDQAVSVNVSNNSRGSPYIPRPQLDNQGSKKILVGVLLLALVAGAGILHFTREKNLSAPTASAVAPVSNKILGFSSADVDEVKTAEVKAELKQGRVPAIVKDWPPAARQQILAGTQKIYAMTFLDTDANDGDTVALSLNNDPVGFVILNNQSGTKIYLPLTPGTSIRLQISAIADGGGGVTFGAKTSVGQQFSRVMQQGEVDVWTLIFK